MLSFYSILLHAYVYNLIDLFLVSNNMELRWFMSHSKHHRKYDEDIIRSRKPKEAIKQERHKHIEIFDREADDKSENYCGLKLTNSKMITECTSEIVVDKKRQDYITVRLPVVISEIAININIQNTIKFTRSVSNLFSVKKKVILRQCKLIVETNKLFLNGVVIKSIEYNEEVFRGSSNSKGKVKNITINIPFQCVTRVEYINSPKIDYKKKEETKIFKMINGDQTFVDSYREGDEIYCELVRADFNELNINGCNDAAVRDEHIHTFRRLKQKMVMKLTVRLLQKQIIFIKKDRNDKLLK